MENKMNWEKIDTEGESHKEQRSPYSVTYRSEVPSGWLVNQVVYAYDSTIMTSSICFVSDLNHEWHV